MTSPESDQLMGAGDLRQMLTKLAQNLAWTWVPEIRRPFQMLDVAAYEAGNHSVWGTLAAASDDSLRMFLNDAEFMHAVSRAEQALERETSPLSAPAGTPQGMRVAYLCSEYALHESMPQYAGGLGVLAGDHLKSASELGIPLCAVGIFYSQGYYRQELAADGATRVAYPSYDPITWPLMDTGCSIACPIGRRRVKVRIWRLDVGRVPLYLMDTNLRANRPDDRALTEGLYKGETQLRLRQQVLLGVGAVMALEAVGERPTVYHMNEGHAAFAPLQRVARLMQGGTDQAQALVAVRNSTVFTTHTPVPAGHDRYGVRETVVQLKSVLRTSCISPATLASMGREDPADRKSPLCMTALALRLSARANGVSQLHGEISRDMWKAVRHLDGTAIQIGHITNGVHVRTWISDEARRFWQQHAGVDLTVLSPQGQGWQRVDQENQIDHAAFWRMRAAHRRRLVHFVRSRLARQALRRGDGERGEMEAMQVLSPEALTIGFARRFATYKRAGLIFSDIDRLAHILVNAQRPVQLVFAGKAHPRDMGGQAVARQVFQLQADPRLRGRVALIEDYDMHVGRVLTSGCDLWLNNPLRPYEASGTSGMKPPLHGGLNLSVQDGWWPEAADGMNGWSVPLPSSEAMADQEDAEALYRLLESQVVPTFYDCGSDGIPHQWIKRSLHGVATIPPQFNSHRMLTEYLAYYAQQT